ncbi:di-heme oxidoredictase family protein [Allorhizobium undicola]|uniref:di-heme oxidoreductase family protein n=1 Tax=Allorhizobium undicola TaxID=78527 RepID=UPI003D3495EE
MVLLSALPASAQERSARADLGEADRARVADVTRPATDFSRPEPFEAMTAGAASFSGKPDHDAFRHPLPTLSLEDQHRFVLGKALFEKFWVSSPSSTQASDGLGPLFNARSCESCHQGGGRGRPPRDDGDATSMFLRLARPARTAQEEVDIASLKQLNFPDATYGRQLQDQAVPGLAAEGHMAVTYGEETVTLSGGEVVRLQKPAYAITGLAYGALEAGTTLSPRMANPMIGMGLIEAIAPEDILALADPDDRNGDGISGKPSFELDHRSHQRVLGRFGWKAENGTVRDQSASALAGDIGISSPDDPRHAGDCTAAEKACLALPNGVQARLGPVEAPPPVLDLITLYSESLAPPRRRNVADPQVLRGKQNFYAAGCTSCHQPKFVTRRDAANPAFAFQLIWPYSDFLLHDMGDGLADGQQVGLATGREWRTPPLWGLGLARTVNGHGFYLHDGRARSLEEAILWHGGEAEKAADAFKTMQPDDRRALITFLESL